MSTEVVQQQQEKSTSEVSLEYHQKLYKIINTLKEEKSAAMKDYMDNVANLNDNQPINLFSTTYSDRIDNAAKNFIKENDALANEYADKLVQWEE